MRMKESAKRGHRLERELQVDTELPDFAPEAGVLMPELLHLGEIELLEERKDEHLFDVGMGGTPSSASAQSFRASAQSSTRSAVRRQSRIALMRTWSAWRTTRGSRGWRSDAHVFAGEPVLVEPVLDGAHADVEHLGGLRGRAVRRLERRQDRVALDLGHRRARDRGRAPCRRAARRRWAGRRASMRVALAEHDRALDRVLELAHVAGPAVRRRASRAPRR